MNNGELVMKAQKGDKEAFGKLIDIHKGDMYRIAFSYMRNKEEAMDIVGDAVYKGFIGIKKLKNGNYFKTWIIRILINTANSAIKKKNKERSLFGFFREAGEVKDHEMVMDLRDAIKSLDRKSKNIVILKYYNGFTLENISEILECPLGTVKSNLSRTLKKLKISLEDELEDSKGGDLLYERSR